MTRNERKLKALEQEMARYSSEIKDIWKKADEDDRETSPEERGEVEERLKAIETLKEQKAEAEAAIKVEEQVSEVSRGLGNTKSVISSTDARVINESPRAKSMGELFITSDAFKSIQVGSTFSTGAVEVASGWGAKGTLLEGSGAPGSGSGGGWLTTPEVVPGVVDTLFQRLTIADLIAPGTTTSNTLRYVVEGTATSGAAGVGEGGTKPQSTLGVGTRDEPVKKIATTLPVSDEMLEDASQVQSYINGRLGLFVRIEEERQILSGAGTNELVGFLDSGRAINRYARGTVDSNAVAMFKALNGTRGSAFLEPDAIVMNPANWAATRLLTDTAGQFFGGGPFQGPYGNGQNIQQSGQVSGALDYMWNKPVIVTSAIGAGTALIGSFRTASQLFRRSGLTIEASNSHNDYFERNLVMIRAEQRLGLAIYRPAAFTMVTGLAS
jgi:HK97 family phage major capsid protein